ncbi:MAG: A/G-specific adenine glycosylase [Rhodocyclaceae bacterium]
MSGAQDGGKAGESGFAARLIDWQGRHGRHDLPWQQTNDAYRIWLSEIMLQQTQVSTVVPYYLRFLERFPDLAALAAAPIESVLELWAGLGYYARGRNLHRCAQIIVAEHGGRFAQDPQKIAELPGIGRSTAAAISAFAFGTRAAILDGNVKRVLARCFGIEGFPGTAATEKTLWALAEALLPEKGIAAYTQGLMDLGATRCTRGKPFCSACPMHDICHARQTGRQAELPAAKAKKRIPERETSVLLLTDGQRILLERRPASGIWGGLLALPEVGADAAETLALRHGCRILDRQALAPLRHSFTHFRLTLRPLLCRIETTVLLAAEAGWEWLPYEEITTAALPTPVRKLLRQLPGTAAGSVQSRPAATAG